MREQIIGFVGGGNMATALISGLIDDGYDPQRIWVSDLDEKKLSDLHSQFGLNISTENDEIVAHSQVLVLAVKPQVMRVVAQEIGASVRRYNPVVLSIAAGIRETDLNRWLGGTVTLVRSMPNTPALIRTAATALYANDRVRPDQRDIAESVMRSVGLVVWVDQESEMDAVTALSGSGPAYFFLLMETLEQAALDLGMTKQTARLLIEQTALGAAKLALEVEGTPAELRRRVTSPGGTTQHAIEVFEKGGLAVLVGNAMRAAYARSIEMSDEFGGD